MEVLDDEDRGPVRGQVAEEAEDQAEQASLVESAARIGGGDRWRDRGGRCRAGPGPTSDPADGRKQARDVATSGTQDGVDTGSRQIPEEAPERLGQGCVRHAVLAEIQAAATQDVDIVRPEAGQERIDEAGLADTGLTGDDQDLRVALADAVERGDERLQLGRPADDLATADGAGHARKSTRRSG